MVAILNVVAPVFLVITTGYFLRIRSYLPENAPGVLSWIVFYVAAPALLFRSAAMTPVESSLDLPLVGAVFLTTLIATVFGYLLQPGSDPSRKGVIVQGIFRSNMVFVGLPVVLNAFGERRDILGPVTAVVGWTVPLYNLLAVLVLAFPHRKNLEWNQNSRRIKRDILWNPLILSSVAGLLYSASGMPLPLPLDRSLDLIGRSAAPMALLVVGASLDFRRWSSEKEASLLVGFGKLIFYPALYLGILEWMSMAGILTIQDRHLAVLLVLAAPTAVAAHIMAKEMGGDESLSASIVVSSTTLSLFSISFWLLLIHASVF